MEESTSNSSSTKECPLPGCIGQTPSGVVCPGANRNAELSGRPVGAIALVVLGFRGDCVAGHLLGEDVEADEHDKDLGIPQLRDDKMISGVRASE